MSEIININYKKYTSSSVCVLEYKNTATLKDINKSIISAYLKYHHQNISKVSKLLGVSRQTIYNHLK